MAVRATKRANGRVATAHRRPPAVLRLENPWSTLPDHSPFVLPADEPYITAFNQSLPESDTAHRLITDLPPAPFAGYHNSPLVVLLGNPGWTPRDRVEQCARERLPLILEAARSRTGTPVYALTGPFQYTSAGRWWRSRTRDLALALGSFDALAERLLVVELHGYHSRKWVAPFVTLPSQWFGFQLVGDAMDRGATIIVARCHRHWWTSVPGLHRYERAIQHLASTRSAYLSRANLAENFDLVLQALEGA